MTFPLKNWPTVKRGYCFGDKTFYSKHHLGVDLIVPEGTEVYAPADCEITVAENFPQGGNTLWVVFDDEDCGRLIMRCMHLQELKPLGKYAEGEVIGYTGNTGEYTDGPHLHLDISRHKVKLKNFSNFIDPEIYFSKIKQPNNCMPTYKKDGEDRIYALAGNVLIPFAVSLEAYKEEFFEADIVLLSAEEFSKYKVAKTLEINEIS
jgi:murein DD-endopeptidase MepM/ murein hydrolase activator NlpD